MADATDPVFTPMNEELIHQGFVIRTTNVTIKAPDGSVVNRDVARHPGAVAIVAVHDNHIIMVRQYRAPVNQYMLEIPAGRLDVPGEDLATAARRELVEEIGFDCEAPELLGSFWNSAGFCDELTHVYLAQNLIATDRASDGVEEEFMEILRYPVATAASMTTNGTITDAKSLLGLMWALPKLTNP